MALMKGKTVSFNMENDEEKALHDWSMAQRIGFSTYVKALIDQDMKRRNRPIPEGKPIEFRVPKEGK
jgi:hypothetical protein